MGKKVITGGLGPGYDYICFPVHSKCKFFHAHTRKYPAKHRKTFFITTCIYHSYLLLSLKLRPQRIVYQLKYSNPILQSTSPHFTIITKNIQKVSLLYKQQKLLRLQQKNPSQKVSNSPTSYLTDITKMAGRKKM